MFFKRDKVLWVEFTAVKKRVGDLEIEIEKLKTHINSLRGLFNRKFAPGATTDTSKSEPSIDGLDQLRENVKPNP